VLTTATWADSLTQLKVFYFPRDIQKRRAMYLVNIIAALLDETALDAAERAEQISQEIKAAMPAGVVTIRDGEIWPHMPGPIPTSLEYQIKEFADSYLFGSEDAAAVLVALLTLKAIDFSPMQIDESRAKDPTRPSGRVYGKQQSRGHRLLSKAIRRADWGKVDLESEKQKAALWVRARHVHQDLKLAIAEKLQAEADRGFTSESDYNHWARVLKPLDEAVGRERKPGRPKTKVKI
jgi:hypothetical protein